MQAGASAAYLRAGAPGGLLRNRMLGIIGTTWTWLSALTGTKWDIVALFPLNIHNIYIPPLHLLRFYIYSCVCVYI